MAITLVGMDIFWYVTLVGYILIFTASVIGAIDYYRHKDVFPFTKRVTPLLNLYYVAALLETGGFVVKHAITSTDCLVEIREDPDTGCPQIWYFHIFYCYFANILVIIYVLRGYVLLYRHKVTDLVEQMFALQRSKDSAKLEKIGKIQNSIWIRKRHFVKPIYLQGFVFVYFLGQVGLTHLIYAFQRNMLVNVVHALAFIQLLQVPYLAHELGKCGNDNFGIKSELKTVGVMCLLVIIVFTVVYLLVPGMVLYYRLGDLLLLFILGIALGYTLFSPLRLVDRSINVVVPINEQDYSRYSKMKGTTGERDTVSRVFKSKLCMDKSFHGVIRSEEGFDAFMEFLIGEFATENLIFWKLAQELRASITEALSSSAFGGAKAKEMSKTTGRLSLSMLIGDSKEVTRSKQQSMSAFDQSTSIGNANLNQDAEDIKRVNHDRIPFIERATDIHDLFIARNAVRELNLKAKVASGVKALLAELPELVEGEGDDKNAGLLVGYDSTPETIKAQETLLFSIKEMFRDACKEVAFLMERDSFKRFMKTEAYQNLAKTTEV